MYANPDIGITRTQAAAELGVTPHTVSMWIQRGWITQNGQRRHVTILGHDRHGARLARRGDLLDAERDTRRNPNSPRNPARAA